MRGTLITTSLVITLGLAFSAKGVEPPEIISWANSKTGDEKTVFQVKPGESITFSVKAGGADKYLWLVDGHTQEAANAESFKWTAPRKKGVWKICVKTTNTARRRWAGKEAAVWKGRFKPRLGRRGRKIDFSEFVRQVVDLNVYPFEARKEWIVATFLTKVDPGRSIQKAIDSLPVEGGIVELAPGVHDVRKTIYIKISNVVVCGTRKSEIKAHDGVRRVFVIPNERPKTDNTGATFGKLENLVFRGFKVTSSFTKHIRGGCVIVAWNVDNLVVEEIENSSYLGRIVVTNSFSHGDAKVRSKNVIVRNNIGHHSAMSLYHSNPVYVVNNIFKDDPHPCWGLHIDTGNRDIHVVGNYVRNCGVNGSLVMDVGGPYNVRNNNVVGANQIGIYMEAGVHDAIISNNTITGAARYAGILAKPQGKLHNILIINNRISGCRGIGIHMRDIGYNVQPGSNADIINNVICNNASDGIRMNSRFYSFLNASNNIITGNKGYGINCMEGKVTLSHNDVWNNAQGNYNKCAAGPGDISVDPLFADLTKRDFHLKSKTGRWDLKTKKWVKDKSHSTCIDAGDPKSDFSKEPAPNGGRVNMGAYGNTGQASKSTIQKKGHTGEIMSKKKQANPQTQALAKRLEEHLEKNILSFLLRYSPDKDCGGFVTQLDRQGKWYGKRTKRLVPQTRMVWTFSSAHRAGLGGGKYLQAARDGLPFLLKYMWDEKESGWYWSVTRKGKPGSTRKRIYAQAFGIYGLCEYYFASGDKEALSKAEKTFDLLEKHAYDKKHGGYFTGDFTRNWKRKGSTNRSAGTHLHLVESFVSLVRATGKEKYRKRLKELLDILVDKLFLPEYGCNVEVYTEDWKPIIESDTLYVHDLEAAWLIIDVAKAMGLKDKKYLERARNLVDYSIKYAWDEKHGGFFQKGAPGKPATNTKKNYNVQGEGLVALATLYRETRDKKYFQKLKEHAKWCLEVQADSKYGEWFTMCTAGGKPTMIEKAGLWKAGYHHPRGCLFAAKILQGIKKRGK